MAIKRTRNYATILYDNLEQAKDILKDLKVSFLVSPFHDRDLTAAGEPKKPHYHLIFLFDGPKTLEQARDLVDKIGAVGCEPIVSIRSYARYLCHLDDPDKAQYSVNDVFAYGPGADYMTLIALSSDRYGAIGEMMDFVDENGCASFAELMRYSRHNNEVWFRALCDNSAFIMREYIKSAFWEVMQE